jgi:predicted short-subunit dehydrogenase-like oxidoreductase (DUF2520 family)
MPRISIIGTGNLATALLEKWRGNPEHALTLVGRNIEKGKTLATKWTVPFVPLGQRLPAADVRLVAVSDSAVESVFRLLPPDAPVAHCAGGQPLLHKEGVSAGVFWPIQSFSAQRAIEWNHLPIAIEADNDTFRSELRSLARSLSATPHDVTGPERQALHCAAVMVNNFVNHLLSRAKKLTDVHGADFSLLGPLMHETIAKALTIGPENAQTGPAKRNDQPTINTHMKLLADKPDLAVLYAFLSKNITRTFNE